MLRWFVSAVCCVNLVTSQVLTTVTTELGDITGKLENVRHRDVDYTINTFLGIPYAKPPIGEKRFKKTELLTASHDQFNALKFGPACPQLPSPTRSDEYNPQSEDCLFLNIYTPDGSSNSVHGLYAVMVYLHGGGFMFDAAEMFSGDVISATNDVIVVTINYRIGIFGFLSLGVPDGHGNLGFWDQHIALQWVNKHIGAFGGDKSKVTLFGESAGGQSVIFQALFSQNAGLFQRFISESGNPSIFPESRLAVNFDPKAQLEYVSTMLGCDNLSLDDTVICLQSDSLNTTTIMRKLRDLATNLLNQPLLMFIPTIDGEIIKTDPANLKDFRNPQQIDDLKFYRSLDMLTGFNNKEGALFAFLFLPDVEQFQPTLEQFYQMYIPVNLQIASVTATPTLIDMIRSEYTDWTDTGTTVGAVQDQYIQLWLDLMYSMGTLSFAHLHDDSSGKGSRYMYRFSAWTTNHIVPTPSWVHGANHGDELPFVFGFSQEMESTLFGTRYQIPADWELDLSDKMRRYWTNFAKTGNPNTPTLVSPSWPRYDKIHQRYMELEQNMSDSSTNQFLLSDKLNFWINVYPSVVGYVQNKNEQCGL